MHSGNGYDKFTSIETSDIDDLSLLASKTHSIRGHKQDQSFELKLLDSHQPPQCYRPDPHVPASSKFAMFSGLFITTGMSLFLVATSSRNWTVPGPGGLYYVTVKYRASYQLVVQVVASILGLIHVTIVAILINYTTRLRLASRATSLDALRFWHNLCARKLAWSLPLQFLVPLIGFIVLTVVPSALWAGAITLVSISVTKPHNVTIPSYANATLIHEYADKTGATVPQVRTTRGYFTYIVGEGLLGSLLDSASTATTLDGTRRQHPKLDNTRFTYSGRSFGVGAAVGLLDDSILNNTLAISYAYQEIGYNAQVTCIYNSSSNYFIEQARPNIYAVTGSLPNSGIEYSDYFGYSADPIVVIGVASVQIGPQRILGIAAGADYGFLDQTQCSVIFQPTLYNVTVGITGRNITVAPIFARDVPDISPSGNLSATTMRQFQHISTDQDGLYTSLVGNSFRSSISDFNLSLSHAGLPAVNESVATLAGLSNSVTAMIDDMLGAYAAAQLMVAHETGTTAGEVEVLALRFGQDEYIWAIFGVNVLVLGAVVVEAWRTRGWRGLGGFDYMDLGDLVVRCSRGDLGVIVPRGEGLDGGDDDDDYKGEERRRRRTVRVLYKEGKMLNVGFEVGRR